MKRQLQLHPIVNMAWLAREIGVTRSTVSRWVSGQRSISDAYIEQVAIALARAGIDILSQPLIRTIL
jgi:transcriptional regulator with XRE-family HTH domain